jgi:uncharacterized membrane protein
MPTLWLYLATAVPFLLVDAVMLTLVMKPLFSRHVGEMLLPRPELATAGLFYAAYAAGIVWFAGLPALRGAGGPEFAPDLGTALLNGAILGALAYGTYEFTNKATLAGWSWSMVAADLAWGTVLTAGSAALGVWLVSALGLWRA